MPNYPEDYEVKEQDPRYSLAHSSPAELEMTSAEWLAAYGPNKPITHSEGTGGGMLTLTDQQDGRTAYISRDTNLTELCITINGKGVYLTHEQAVALANFILHN